LFVSKLLENKESVGVVISPSDGLTSSPVLKRNRPLRQLKGEVGGPWTIVWDRNQIHSKSRVVRAWLAKHPEVVVEDFPAHAPDTNPDEEVWCWTKYSRLCNLAPADVNELRGKIWDALTALRDQPQLLTSFILHARIPLLLR
jgi:hypothetical protein